MQYIDFHVSVIDNYGDMGFAVNLALSLHEKYSSLRIRFFSDDRNLFRKFFMGNTPEWMEYMPLSALDQESPPHPSELIYSFFDYRIPKGYLARFSYPKTVVSFSYFLLHTGLETLHTTTYMLESGYDTVIHFVPSLLSGGWGIIINPEIERRKLEFVGLSKMEARMNFLWNRHFECILKRHPELVSGSSTASIISEINGKIPDRSPEWRLKSICEKKWISVFVYPETLEKILPVIRSDTSNTVFWICGGAGWIEETRNCRTLPFLQLEDYGVFQSLCDANIVRGENSLCQGIISGKPLLWDIYKEKNEAHVEKIEDFIQFLRPFFSKDTFDGYARIFREFNRGKKGEALIEFLDMTEELQPGFEKVAKYVREECDLVEKLEGILRI